MMAIDAELVLADVWDVYLDSDGTMCVVGEVGLNQKVEIEIMAAPSEYTLLSQVKQVQALLLFAMKRVFDKAISDCDLFSQVHKIIWYPKDFRLDVGLVGTGFNDIIRIGICSSFVEQGLISSIFAQAIAAQVPFSFGPDGKFPDVASDDVLCLQARSPLCPSCDEFASPSNLVEFTCGECEVCYESVSRKPTCWRCTDCDFNFCNDCFPVEDSRKKSLFKSRFMFHQVNLEGQTFIDSFQALLLDAREQLASGDPHAWAAPVIRALRLTSSLQDSEVNDALIDMLPSFATASDGILRLHGNPELFEASAVPLLSKRNQLCNFVGDLKQQF